LAGDKRYTQSTQLRSDLVVLRSCR